MAWLKAIKNGLHIVWGSYHMFWRDSMDQLRFRWKNPPKAESAYTTLNRPFRIFYAIMIIVLHFILFTHVLEVSLIAYGITPTAPVSTYADIFTAVINCAMYFGMWYAFKQMSINRVYVNNSLKEHKDFYEDTSHQLEEIQKVATSVVELVSTIHDFITDNDLDTEPDIVAKFNKTLKETNNYILRREEIASCRKNQS